MAERSSQASARTAEPPPDELGRPLAIRAKATLAAEILRLYGAARWRLAREGLRPTLDALREASPRSRPPTPAQARVQAVRLARAVRRTLALLPTDSRCLMQSLVLTGLLARRGIGSELIIGVRPGTPFSAHAWLEHEGRPLPPGSEASYQRLAQL